MNRRRFLLASAAALPFAPPFARPGVAQDASGYEDALDRLPQMRSLMIRRGDAVIFARARRSGDLDRPANIKSCSKSLVALLLGAAIARGEIPGVDARLGDVAPDLIPADATAGVADITLEDLVTLRAGLGSTSGPNYGAWVGSRDWVAYALRQPMEARPGGRMIYSTGSTHVLGAALAEATGLSLLAQARERLGAPLGIEIPAWIGDPQGYYFGGNDMALTPRAMLAVATMMRDGGRHDGRQVVSPDWMRASLRPRARSPWSGMAYGYGWFLSDSGYALARGYGGQVIAAHPARGLAVAITSDPTRPARSAGYFGDIMDLLDGPILSA
ncbi:MAG: serine hydrolase domain-containing protein [Pseudomonadota bacterium]|nr:serine hydrolase domain-containing protein [Pseudomonadota bacterium]